LWHIHAVLRAFSFRVPEKIIDLESLGAVGHTSSLESLGDVV